MTPNSWMNVAAAVYILLSLLVLYGLFRGVAWLLRRLSRALGSEGKLLGGDIKIRLLGLAVTAVLFTPLLNRVFRALLNLFVLLIDRVPRQLLAHWRTQADLCSAEAAARCVGDTLLVPLKATGVGIAAAVRDSGLLSIGLGYVVFMLALWALATHTLNALTTRKHGEERLDVHELLLDDNFKVFRQNFLFFLILFVGAYLSLASIAAIPDLREEEGAVPTGFSGATLAENLGKVEWGVDVKRDVLTDPLALADSLFYPGLASLGRAADRPVSNAAATTTTTTTTAPATTTERADTGVIRRRTATDDAEAQPRPTNGEGEEADGSAAAVQDDAEAPTGGRQAAAAQPDGAAEEPVDSVGAAMDSASPPARLNPAIPPAQLLLLRAEAEELRKLWTNQTVRHDSVVRGLARRRNNARQLAQSAYVVADTTRRLREQRTYYHRLQRWYLEAQMDLQGEYDESWLILRRLHGRTEGWSTALAGYLTGAAPDSAQFQQLRREATRLRAEEWLLAEHPPRQLAKLPDRGAGLGPFQYVSGWLLKTDSMPLTLIVGMVGFGLLGAAASTFVREQTRRERREARRLRRLEKQMMRRGMRDPHLTDEMRKPGDGSQPIHPVQPLVLNLPSVVIRGGSAAIVVFLGLMGGLSVLTQEADPNPYALLFTCLAGAVFSEKVWSWAEKRFGLNLDSDDSDRDEGDEAQDGGNGEDGGGGSGGRGDGNGGDGDGKDGNGGGENGNGDGADDGDADDDAGDEVDPADGTRPAEIHVVPPDPDAGDGEADGQRPAPGAEGAVG
jgi:hypothetical protein